MKILNHRFHIKYNTNTKTFEFLSHSSDNYTKHSEIN